MSNTEEDEALSEIDYDEPNVHPPTPELVWETDGYSHYCSFCGWEEDGPDLPLKGAGL